MIRRILCSLIDIIEQKRLQWYGHVKINYGSDTTGEGKEDVQEKRGWKEYKQP